MQGAGDPVARRISMRGEDLLCKKTSVKIGVQWMMRPYAK
jgi:hypothetical protein